MAGGRDAIDAHRNLARFGNLGGDLGGGQHPAMSGLGTLTELELDHLDLRVGGLFGKAFWIEGAVMVPAPEIARADLVDQIAAALTVIAADPAFAGVMGKAAHLGPLIKRKDRIGRERAEGHCGNIVERRRIGLLAVGPANDHAKVGAFEMRGLDRMGQPGITRLIDLFMTAEGTLVFGAL